MKQQSPTNSTPTSTLKEPSFKAPTRKAILQTTTGKFPIEVSDSTSVLDIKRAWAQHKGNFLDDETLHSQSRFQ